MKWFIQNKRKVELWEKDKTPMQRAIINAKIRFREWNRKTHGIGMIMILLVIVLMLVNIPAYIKMYSNEPQKLRIQQEIIIGSCDIGGKCYKFA